MDSTRRTRTRPADRRPQTPPRAAEPVHAVSEKRASRCPHCLAHVEARFVRGMLVQVLERHSYPCNRDLVLPIGDWRGQVDQAGLRTQYAGQYNPGARAPEPRPTDTAQDKRLRRHKR